MEHLLSMKYMVVKNKNDGYTLLGNITNEKETAFEHITSGDEIWYYYMQSNYDCLGATVLTSDTLDNLPPAVSPLLSASVENDLVRLNWEASISSSNSRLYYLSLNRLWYGAN